MRSGPAATIGMLLGLALILPGCGDEQTTAAGSEAPATNSAASSKPAAKPGGPGPARRCSRSLGEFLDSLESLGNTLAVGLSYDGYLGAVNHVRAAYDGVKVDRLRIGCLVRVGGPAEEALNVYIEAANTWGECLASASCDSAEIEPELQQRWARAADHLSSARSGLQRLE